MVVKKLSERDALHDLRNKKLVQVIKMKVNYDFLSQQSVGDISKRSQKLGNLSAQVEKGEEYIEIIDKLLNECSRNTQKNSEGEGETEKEKVEKES